MDITKEVTLIDKNDQVICHEDVYSAHQHPAKRHRAVSVWLVREMQGKKEILFQKRSLEKIVGADQWGNAICGNVKPEESYGDCAIRRLREEIGVTDIELSELYKFEYHVYSNEKYGENEVDQVFIGEYNGEFELNPAEVSQVEWVDLDELLMKLDDKEYISAEGTLEHRTDELQDKTPPMELIIEGRTFEIAPWTLIMLFDQKLQTALRDF